MHRLTSAFRSCPRYVARPLTSPSKVLPCRRSISFSSPRHATEASTPDVENDADMVGDLAPDSMNEEGSETPRSYKQFMDKIGYQYRFARPHGWLGQDVPFPMNPSFKPPPPISNHQREIMWQLFSRSNRKYSVRRLAKRFNLSIKRVDAILRLKGMEQDWVKGKELQTGFLQGMEGLLNAQTHTAIPGMQDLLQDMTFATDPDVVLERSDVYKADMLEQEEQRDATAYRYERLYWESIPEDADEPILPNLVQHVKKRAEIKRKADERKQKGRFMKNVPNTPFIGRSKRRVLIRHRKNGPPTKFVDIGAEFVDVGKLTKRAAIAARKSSIRAKRAKEKKLALDASRTRP